ncbi:transposase [Chroococcidiopsis cubana]|nr:transposase [Chroococcidiopsis cubana]
MEYAIILGIVQKRGVMEGMNNRIKLIMRQGYGFSNFDNFRSRLLACLGD